MLAVSIERIESGEEVKGEVKTKAEENVFHDASLRCEMHTISVEYNEKTLTQAAAAYVKP